MSMSKIVWITEDSFVDCDWVPISQVSMCNAIEWVVLFHASRTRYKEEEFNDYLLKHQNLRIHFFHMKYSAKDIRNIVDFLKLGHMVKKIRGDVYYVNSSPSLPWFFAFWGQLPSKKRVITAHQGAVHLGMSHKWLISISRKLVYGHAQNVNMFSTSQAELFSSSFPKSNVTIIDLALKDYGQPSIKKASGKDDCVNFLAFGILNFAKNIDLLIDAACNLYEKGIRGFKVLIYGNCNNWEYYEKHIRYPEIFEIKIGFVPNEDIPNLFSRAHYLVQPYRVVSQSGAMKVAFQYNTPVIVSNLPGLTDELEERVNGFLFEVSNVRSLEDVLKERIINLTKEYDSLCFKMNEYTKQRYSEKRIGEKYINMFNKIS